MAKVNYNELKNECFMRQADKDRFSLRLRIAGGTVKSEQLQKVYEIANKYGEGYIHITARQCIEIPFIKLEDIDRVKQEMAESGLQQGVCGARVRTVTGCQGCKVCPSGLIDTTALAVEFDKRYYANEVPHKFKLGITGCRNNCLKAEENDIGVKGAMKPKWHKKKCTYCGLCENKCKSGAIRVDKENNILEYDESKCIQCGKCVKACPTEAWTGKAGYILYFGGLFGNNIQIGKQIIPTLFSRQEVFKAVEATLEFFRKHGQKGERFGTMLNRVGWEHFRKALETALRKD